MTALVVLLLLAGIGLLAAEAHLPSGALGFSGAAALAAALVLAVTGSGGSLALALALAVPLALGGAAIAFVGLSKARAAARARARCGAEGLLGHVGVVRRPLDPLGQVFVAGELWRAKAGWSEDEAPAPEAGEAVVVERVEGLTLTVRRAEDWELVR